MRHDVAVVRRIRRIVLEDHAHDASDELHVRRQAAKWPKNSGNAKRRMVEALAEHLHLHDAIDQQLLEQLIGRDDLGYLGMIGSRGKIGRFKKRLEALVADIFAEVLEIENVGANDNFFVLGGDSLRGGQVVSRIFAKLGVEIPIAMLFRSPTPGEFATAIQDAGRGFQGRRRSVSQATANTNMANAIPHPICSFQNG